MKNSQLSISHPLPQFVRVVDGVIVQAGYVESDKNLLRPIRFFEQSELRKDGSPDRRCLGHRVGFLRISNGSVVGRWAPVNPRVEMGAEPIRAEIRELELRLEGAKQRLAEHYLAAQNAQA